MALFEILNICTHCFQVLHQTNQLLKSKQGSTNASSKHETADALKQTTENASEELSSAIHIPNFNVFFGFILNSPPIFHIKAHQVVEQT